LDLVGYLIIMAAQRLLCLFLLHLSVISCRNQLSPVILVPGDGGNQLEAKLDIEGEQDYTGRSFQDSSTCKKTSDWYRLWLDIWQLRQGKLGCWADNIKLVYDAKTRRSRNMPGVSTRVPGWGSTSSVEYLDPSWSAWLLADAGNYMHTLVEHLVTQLGYTRDRDVVAAPYDFRYAPQSQAAFFQKLKILIENTYKSNSNRRVTLLSHSMGGLFCLHFLHQQPQDWLDKYIQRFLPLGTPWLGAIIQLNTLISGYNLEIPLIDPLVIREEQRSYETASYLLPHPHTWPFRNQVFVRTPSRNYTVADFRELYMDMNYPEGWDMFQNVMGLTPLSHPRVATTCVYGVGVDTAERLDYGPGFPDSQPRRIMGDGDGTVTRLSGEFCKQFLTLKGDRIMAFNGVSHAEILKDKNVLKFLDTQLGP